MRNPGEYTGPKTPAQRGGSAAAGPMPVLLFPGSMVSREMRNQDLGVGLDQEGNVQLLTV